MKARSSMLGLLTALCLSGAGLMAQDTGWTVAVTAPGGASDTFPDVLALSITNLDGVSTSQLPSGVFLTGTLTQRWNGDGFLIPYVGTQDQLDLAYTANQMPGSTTTNPPPTLDFNGAYLLRLHITAENGLWALETADLAATSNGQLPPPAQNN